MKVIITLLIFVSVISVGHTATLVPSLEKQMQRQTLINKKNAIAEKKAAIEAKKQANKNRLIAIRTQKNTPKVATQYVPSVSSTVQIPSTIQTVKTLSIAASISTTPSSVARTNIAGVDMDRVRSTWLSWYNSSRINKGLASYSYDTRLDSTAQDWNNLFAASRGTILHERNPGDGYYNYSVINKWFQDRGVNPPVVGGVNHSENISYGYYACSKNDCTDDLINSIRSSYIFFINSSVHAKSVYQPNFTKIGFDVIVVPNDRRYYVTVHYMTK